MLEAEHRRDDGTGLGACYADDTDASATRRSGDRNDRVVEIHLEIVAG